MKNRRLVKETISVRDRVAEVGINLNTIFTALVLAGILWVGTILESIKSTIAESSVTFAVAKDQLDTLRDEFKLHKNDPYAHIKYRRTAP